LLAGDNLLIDLIGHLGAGYRHLPMERRGQCSLEAARLHHVLQYGIDQHIDTAEEETSHRRHARQGVASRRPHLQAGEVGVGHLAIVGEAEQQGDVDVDPFTDELLDSWEPC